MSKALSLFYPFVEPEVLGCPHPVIDHHLVLTVRDFCERGLAWREWVDAFTADGTTNQFDYDLARGQELVKVARALRNEDPLQVMSADQLPRDWQSGDSTDLCDAVVHFDDASFMVYPLPASGDVIRLEMVFRPAIDAQTVGDVLYADWAEAISNGCKARLLRMPRQAWSDAVSASGFAGLFERDVSRAANADFAKRGKEARRTRPSPDGSTTWR